MSEGTIRLQNAHLDLHFSAEGNGALSALVDPETGCDLIRDRRAPGLLWRLAVRRSVGGEVEWLDSSQAASFTWHEERGEGGAVLTLTTSGLPGRDLAVTVRVGLADDSALSAWRVEVRGLAQTEVLWQVACPVVSGLVKLGEPAPGESLVAPVQGEGYLFRNPFEVRDHLPLRAGPGPETADVGVGSAGGRYPGGIALQMLALYNDQAGVYFAAHDAGQHPKDLVMGPWPQLGEGPVLAMTHLTAEIPGQDWTQPYDAMLGVFHGDWYDAADIYRAWATRQWWCEKKLWERDIPGWVRAGVGGVFQMSNYHMPRLDLNHSLSRIAETVNEVSADAGVPLLALIFNWEGSGAWTGPKGFFPPREGEGEFRAAMQSLRAAGNRGFVYITGGCWYLKNAYEPPFDSWPAFEAEGRAHATKLESGDISVGRWYDGWEATRICPVPEYATELHADILLQCLDLGCEVVQIDNFPCVAAEACYDPTHGHPPGFGSWWAEAWGRMLAELRRRAKARTPDCALSAEGVSEGFLPWLDLYDQRAPNMEYFGHYQRGQPMGGETIPLFNYVYGEYIGAYCAAMPECNRPEVLYWTRCLGKAICQGVLPTAGRYFPQPPGLNPTTLGFYKKIVRATGRELYPYLMFGEMLRPPPADSPLITAQYCKFIYDGPRLEHAMNPSDRHEVRDRAVQNAAYRGYDGSVALVFANVSEDPVDLEVEVPEYGFAAPVELERITDSVSQGSPATVTLPHLERLEMAPLSVTVLILRPAGGPA